VDNPGVLSAVIEVFILDVKGEDRGSARDMLSSCTDNECVLPFSPLSMRASLGTDSLVRGVLLENVLGPGDCRTESEPWLVLKADSMPLIASIQVSGQLLFRRERLSNIKMPSLAYFRALVVENSPSDAAYIKIRQAIQVAQVNDGQVSGAWCLSLSAASSVLWLLL
jgi:hypothetical protein